jgi:hypothetical protein
MIRKRMVFVVVFGLLLLVIVSVVVASVQQGSVIAWYTFGSAGSSAQSASGQVELDSTLGQAIAGFSLTTDQGIALSSGYWYAIDPESYAIHLPIVIR